MLSIRIQVNTYVQRKQREETPISTPLGHPAIRIKMPIVHLIRYRCVLVWGCACVRGCVCVCARKRETVCVHSVAWCFLNNQPTWACLVTCIHYILDFGVVKSKLNLHLYITEFLYSCRPIFFLVSYIAVMNLANCLTFVSVINDSISQNGFPGMVLLPPPPPRCPPTATCVWGTEVMVSSIHRHL